MDRRGPVPGRWLTWTKCQEWANPSASQTAFHFENQLKYKRTKTHRHTECIKPYSDSQAYCKCCSPFKCLCVGNGSLCSAVMFTPNHHQGKPCAEVPLPLPLPCAFTTLTVSQSLHRFLSYPKLAHASHLQAECEPLCTC